MVAIGTRITDQGETVEASTSDIATANQESSIFPLSQHAITVDS
jgi:hypothetical protein